MSELRMKKTSLENITKEDLKITKETLLILIGATQGQDQLNCLTDAYVTISKEIMLRDKIEKTGKLKKEYKKVRIELADIYSYLDGTKELIMAAKQDLDNAMSIQLKYSCPDTIIGVTTTITNETREYREALKHANKLEKKEAEILEKLEELGGEENVK